MLKRPDGTELRGHEFHYSCIMPEETGNPSIPDESGSFSVGSGVLATKPFLDAQGKPVETSLFCTERIIASYVHWSPEAIVELITKEKWKL